MNTGSTSPWVRHLPGPAGGPFTDGAPDSEASLRELYDRYCRSQVSQLLGLVPRDAIRVLYRAALADGAEGDPMALLAAYCRTLLPLPPFPAWVKDFREHRLAHLQEMSRIPGGGVPLGPVPVETRSVLQGHVAWTAALHLFRDHDVWRGFISFTPQGSDDVPSVPASRTVRTADIFQEDEPEEVCARFREFAPPALKAFLRSSLP